MNPQTGTYFRIGYRLALIPAITTGLLLFLVGLFWTSMGWGSLALGFSGAAVVFLLVYISASRLLKKRCEHLRSLIRDVPLHGGNKANPVQMDHLDEVEALLHEMKWSRELITQEFRKMDEAENYRKEFIGDISHELKTPIFSVQGYLETLLNGALNDPEVNELFLSKAMKNVNRLIVLTNDLMEISRLETGELKPDLSVIPLNNLINDVVDSLQYKAQQQRVRIVFDKKEVNSFALADRNQVRQVIVNLIDNAIKYNTHGGRIEISTCFSSSERKKLIVSIRDTGIGISSEDIKRVTERFYRVDKSRSREQGGTGLGLSIVKHILESHKEQLEIESIPGQGSVFRFQLPCADSRQDPVSA